MKGVMLLLLRLIAAVAGALTRSLSFCSDREYRPEPFESERLPVTLSPEIQRFLCVAYLMEREEASYCLPMHYAFEITHKLDRDSIGWDVQQFKTSLLQRLEQDDEITLFTREAKSDMRELKCVYRAYKDYTIKNFGLVDINNEEKMTIARRVAEVLFEVYKIITDATSTKTD